MRYLVILKMILLAIEELQNGSSLPSPKLIADLAVDYGKSERVTSMEVMFMLDINLLGIAQMVHQSSIKY